MNPGTSRAMTTALAEQSFTEVRSSVTTSGAVPLCRNDLQQVEIARRIEEVRSEERRRNGRNEIPPASESGIADVFVDTIAVGFARLELLEELSLRARPAR
jgi:hypothetical protein